MPTILVTGAAGFVGSHLIENLLAQNNIVIGVDNFDSFYPRAIKEQNLQTAKRSSQFEFYKIDITDIDSLLQIDKKIDAVVHLASKAGVLPSVKDPSGYIKTNVLGTQNILEFMKERSVKKLIYGSSSSIYGNNKKIPFEEYDNVDHPISPYAQTKKASELINYTYHHLYDIDVINLRFFTVYGPRQRPDLAIHKFINLIANNKPIVMYGDGSSSRDYTYIDDIIDGISLAINYIFENENVCEIFNIGSNYPIKLIDLINELYAITGFEKNIVTKEFQPGDVQRTYANIDKAKSTLGYSPITNLHQGLERFWDWYLKSNTK